MSFLSPPLAPFHGTFILLSSFPPFYSGVFWFVVGKKECLLPGLFFFSPILIPNPQKLYSIRGTFLSSFCFSLTGTSMRLLNLFIVHSLDIFFLFFPFSFNNPNWSHRDFHCLYFLNPFAPGHFISFSTPGSAPLGLLSSFPWSPLKQKLAFAFGVPGGF